MTGPALKSEILACLERLHAAQRANDVDGMLKAYSDRGFVDVARMRTYFEGLVERGAFLERSVDLTECEIFVHGGTALVLPVTYHTRNGPRFFSFHLSREEGEWRIIENNRSQPRGERFYTAELMANAGKVVGHRGMLWTRRLDVPVGDVWAAVSTKEGIEKWWIIRRSVELDLRPGGLFRHHWTNTVRDFETNSFIDFVGAPGDASSPNHLMRFELEPDGAGTVFSFLDTFEGAQSPLTLPWTASGWHGTIDALERALTGRAIENDFGLGGEFYWRYLRNFHRFDAMVRERNAPDAAAEEWRRAYLAESL